MALTKIYIVRHGFRSDWSPPLKLPTGSTDDPALSAHGVHQAQELAQFIVSAPDLPKPQLIFSSPLYRCVETVYPLAQSLGVEIFLDKGLSEWYKPFRGKIPEPPSVEQLSEFFPHCLSKSWDSDTIVPIKDGETEADIFKRCQRFWHVFLPKLATEFPEVETILLVSHAATKIALGMALLGYHDSQQFLGPEHGGDGVTTRIGASTCSLDLYTFHDTWTVHFVGNTEFLSGGQEMEWHFATSKYVAGSQEELAERRERAKRIGGGGSGGSEKVEEIEEVGKTGTETKENLKCGKSAK